MKSAIVMVLVLMASGCGALHSATGSRDLVFAVHSPSAVMWTADEPMTADDGTALTVSRGHIRVPELRTSASGEIELAVIRIRRADAAPQTRRAHMILAGGPGDSGVEQALGLALHGGGAWFDLLGEGDLIAIDQRGVGASRPNLASTIRYGLPQDRAGTPELWTATARLTVEAEAARVRATGVHLSAYNSQESADDVEAVRRAMGYDRLVLWGRSYGTHLAQAIARRYSSSIERLVLISPEGLDDTFKSPARTDRALQRIADQAGEPDLPLRLRQVLAQLRESPVTVTVRNPADGTSHDIVVGAFDVQWAIANALGDPRALTGLPATVQMMSGGDFNTIGQLVYILRQRAGVGSAMKQAMDLASGATAARAARNRAEASDAVLGDAINWPGPAFAEHWGIEPLPDAFRAPLSGDVPVLLVVGDLDVRTPVENAEAIAAHLSRAHIIVVANGAHEFSLFANPELVRALQSFLRGEVPTTTRVAFPVPGFQH
jgi:pimeloyl-ACP methyl ester carboxylesterase